MKKALLLNLVLLLPLTLVSVEKDKSRTASASIPEAKTVQAVRSVEPVKIDGLLEENVWQREGASDFTQSDPDDGARPTEKTEVWVA